MTTELILVRHGETHANATHTIAGWTDVALTTRGQKQASAIRGTLARHAVDAVWSSDLIRTVHTGQLAWGEPEPDARIRELNFGELEGVSWKELPAEMLESIRDFERFRAPGGESMKEFLERIHDFVGSLPTGRHLVFTHGGVMRLLLHDLGIDHFVGNCAVVHVDWTAQRLLSERGSPST